MLVKLHTVRIPYILLAHNWAITRALVFNEVPIWKSIYGSCTWKRQFCSTDISSLQQSNGSFCGDEWGEVDTRFAPRYPMMTLYLCHLPSSALSNGIVIDWQVRWHK